MHWANLVNLFKLQIPSPLLGLDGYKHGSVSSVQNSLYALVKP